MDDARLYQLEVKLGLVKFVFQQTARWRVTIHVDPMEMGRGGRHPPGKVERANEALRQLRALGVTIGTHKLFGKVDVVAEHEDGALRLVEVEGESGRQRDQALYSSLGQLLLSMKMWGDDVAYGIAVPDTRDWVKQLRKIPDELTERIRLWRYLLRPNAATSVEPGIGVPKWERD